MTRDEALVSMRRASSWRTICEVHREIYDACEDVQEPVRTLLRELVIETFIMGKKIDEKLREHKANWDSGFYGLNTNRRDDRHRRSA